VTGPEVDHQLEAAAERLVRDQRARPARPGSAEDPGAHQVAAALAGRRPGATAIPPRVRRRVETLVGRELAVRPESAGGRGVGGPGPGPGMTRRQWLTGAGAAVAAGVAGLAIGDLASHLPAAGTERLAAGGATQETLVPTGGTWHAVAAAEAVVAGRPVPFVAGAVTGVLVRDDGGRILALSAICTHLGCRVGWVAADRAFVCPCHGARFTARGRFTGAPWGAGYPAGLPPLPRLRSRVTPAGVVEVLTAL